GPAPSPTRGGARHVRSRVPELHLGEVDDPEAARRSPAAGRKGVLPPALSRPAVRAGGPPGPARPAAIPAGRPARCAVAGVRTAPGSPAAAVAARRPPAAPSSPPPSPARRRSSPLGSSPA